jgi:hypothetical protein
VSPTVPLAAASALVSLAFGLTTFDRWLERRRRHDMAWSVAMALFAIAAGALWWAAARGWSAPSFRIFFLVGAVLNVPWLALGTVYLLAGQHLGDAVARWLLVFSGFATGVVITAATRVPITGEELPKAREVFGPVPRILVAVGSAVPALVIFAGATWSAIRVMRRRQPALSGASRQIARPGLLVAGNVLIALGAVVLTSSGSLAGRLGEERAFAVTLLVGICVLFAGFLVASRAGAGAGAGAGPSTSAAAWRITDDEIAAVLSPVRDGGSSR